MNKKLNELKGSEYHKVVAAIMEVMEKAQFTSDNNVLIQEDKNADGSWQMLFYKENCSLESLNDIKNALGPNFNIFISAKDKKNIAICLKAAGDDFMALLPK